MLKRLSLAGALALGLTAPTRAERLMIAGGGDMAASAPKVVFVAQKTSRAPARARHRHHCLSPRRAASVTAHSDIPNGSYPLLAVARLYLGATKFTPYAGPWCRDFVNLVARRAGYRLANRSRRAIDALRLGRRVFDPRPGDLAVMRHHVTIFAGWTNCARGWRTPVQAPDRCRRLIGLGGNQGHRVRFSSYPPRRVVAFVRL